ncbi:MAG: hypothetical protein K5695_15475 [Oscillospiraceae bacterium]|nr:hypothetical protein [Oscillospiraceae bacterium]
MILAIIFSVITSVALAVFIGLYVDECNRVQETYRTQFNANLAHTIDSVDSYLDADGDHATRYRRILSDMSSADSFAFLLKNLTEEQKITVNELHTCLIKYPEQMQERERMEDFRQALDDLHSNLDKGFEEAQEIIDSIDKMGH